MLFFFYFYNVQQIFLIFIILIPTRITKFKYLFNSMHTNSSNDDAYYKDMRDRFFCQPIDQFYDRAIFKKRFAYKQKTLNYSSLKQNKINLLSTITGVNECENANIDFEWNRDNKIFENKIECQSIRKLEKKFSNVKTLKTKKFTDSLVSSWTNSVTNFNNYMFDYILNKKNNCYIENNKTLGSDFSSNSVNNMKLINNIVTENKKQKNNNNKNKNIKKNKKFNNPKNNLKSICSQVNERNNNNKIYVYNQFNYNFNLNNNFQNRYTNFNLRNYEDVKNIFIKNKNYDNFENSKDSC